MTTRFWAARFWRLIFAITFLTLPLAAQAQGPRYARHNPTYVQHHRYHHHLAHSRYWVTRRYSRYWHRGYWRGPNYGWGWSRPAIVSGARLLNPIVGGSCWSAEPTDWGWRQIWVC